MKQTLFALTIILLFSQCEKPVSECLCAAFEPFELGKQFTVVKGKLYQEKNAANPMMLSNIDITSDSRCPSDVICTWEGRVDVKLQLQQDGKDLSDTLSLPGLIDPNYPINDTITFQGYTVILLAVNPYPTSANAGNIPQSEYKLEMLVSKN